MKPIKPTYTESTFSSNKEVKRNAGGSDFKRESVKDISVSLYDVDYAVKWHLENVVNPTITEENTVVTVPILFSTGEKWVAVQKHGYLRDNQGMILTPLIMIKRNSVSKRDDIQDIKVLETPEARMVFETKYTKKNRYDRFSLTNSVPVKDYYSVDVPKFVQVEYELLCWANNTSQLNEIVEQLIWFDGKAFGDSFKFITHIDPPTFDSSNNTGEERLIRASLSMRTKAHILHTHGTNAPTMYKLNPVNRVVISTETDVAFSNVAGAIQAAVLSGASNNGGSSNSGNTSLSSAMIYINSNKQLTGAVQNGTTVTFASGWSIAPSPLPSTSVDNFTFFVNGQMLERTAIQSFTQAGSSSTLVINTTQLGFTLQTTDEVIGIGKFINQDSLA
jgi:hypothetical protein